MTVTEVAARHRRRLLEIRDAAVRGVRREWRRLNTRLVDDSWANDVGPQLAATMILAQMAAADEADPFLAELAELRGDIDDAAGRIDPEAFAGTAADGRSLESLLYLPVIGFKRATLLGQSPRQAARTGELLLSQIAVTETLDAGRTADGAATAARPRVEGYVRALTPPSCARCVVLAGRFYRWNEGFERHPNCDCVHIPASRADLAPDAITDPRAAVLAGNVEGLSKADRRAIEDGADVSQVINAHRGMYTAGGRKLTTEGTTRRGLAGQRGRRARGPDARLRPEQIYRQADSRDEAIRLLFENGYIV